MAANSADVFFLLTPWCHSFLLCISTLSTNPEAEGLIPSLQSGDVLCIYTPAHIGVIPASTISTATALTQAFPHTEPPSLVGAGVRAQGVRTGSTRDMLTHTQPWPTAGESAVLSLLYSGSGLWAAHSTWGRGEGREASRHQEGGISAKDKWGDTILSKQS